MLPSKSNLWPSVADDSILSDHQKAAVAAATRSPLGILTGSPGTGKTTSAAALIRRVVAQFGERCVAMAAPTGKAAVRFTQSMHRAGVPLRATTIHTLLGIGRNGHDGKGWGFNHNAINPLPHRFVVVDESSMIDASLAASLLQACGDGAHVLLIGDPSQLPPVGHGAPLRDLIAAGVPMAELTEIRRNAGSIVRACAAIKAGERFATDAKYDPNPPLDADGSDPGPRNLRMVEATSDQDAAEVLLRTLTSMKTFEPVWQTQVLVARNEGSAISRKDLNAALQRLLNPDGRAEPNNPFRLGDKVICLKNRWAQVVEMKGEAIRDGLDETSADNYRAAHDPETGDEAETYVANGEIGRIEAISPRQAIARFSEADELIRIPIGKQSATGDGAEGGGNGGQESDDRGAAGDYDLAYAITCHKSQGSESPCVFVMIDEAAGAIASREWHYTAISRASKLCVLIGKRAAIDKQVRRVALGRRKTLLVERVKEARERAAAKAVPS